MIGIGIGGSEGRMGVSVLSAVALDHEIECVLQINHLLDFDQGLKMIAARQTPLLDVFIDFSTPKASLRHLDLCCQHRLPLVLGVTGFSDAEKAILQKAASIIPIVFSPNMSIGVNVSFKLLEFVATLLKPLKEMGIDVDVAIQETHHKHKKDAPSGTALRMGQILAATDYASSRIGEVLGDHTVILALQGERIEINHRCDQRIIFAKGALTAAKWLASIKPKPGLYDMQDVLGFNQ